MCYNFYFYKLLPWIWQSRIYTIFMIIWIYFFKNHIMQGATPCIEMEMAWWWINWPFHGLTDVPEQAIHTSKLPFLQYYLLTYIRDGWGIDPIRLWPDLCHLWWIRGWLEQGAEEEDWLYVFFGPKQNPTRACQKTPETALPSTHLMTIT